MYSYWTHVLYPGALQIHNEEPWWVFLHLSCGPLFSKDSSSSVLKKVFVLYLWESPPLGFLCSLWVTFWEIHSILFSYLPIKILNLDWSLRNLLIILWFPLFCDFLISWIQSSLIYLKTLWFSEGFLWLYVVCIVSICFKFIFYHENLQTCFLKIKNKELWDFISYILSYYRKIFNYWNVFNKLLYKESY